MLQYLINSGLVITISSGLFYLIKYIFTLGNDDLLHISVYSDISEYNYKNIIIFIFLLTVFLFFQKLNYSFRELSFIIIVFIIYTIMYNKHSKFKYELLFGNKKIKNNNLFIYLSILFYAIFIILMLIIFKVSVSDFIKFNYIKIIKLFISLLLILITSGYMYNYGILHNLKKVVIKVKTKDDVFSLDFKWNKECKIYCYIISEYRDKMLIKPDNHNAIIINREDVIKIELIEH